MNKDTDLSLPGNINTVLDAFCRWYCDMSCELWQWHDWTTGLRRDKISATAVTHYLVKAAGSIIYFGAAWLHTCFRSSSLDTSCLGEIFRIILRADRIQIGSNRVAYIPRSVTNNHHELILTRSFNDSGNILNILKNFSNDSRTWSLKASEIQTHIWIERKPLQALMLRYSWQKNGAGSLSLKVVTLDLVQQMKYFSVEMVVRHSSFRRTRSSFGISIQRSV